MSDATQVGGLIPATIRLTNQSATTVLPETSKDIDAGFNDINYSSLNTLDKHPSFSIVSYNHNVDGSTHNMLRTCKL